MKYNRVLVAGTFDRLNQGHKFLLKTAFIHCLDELIIGITDDQIIKNKSYSEIIQSKEIRAKNVLDYIANINMIGLNTQIIFILDKYSISIRDENLNAIVLTDETISTGLEINTIRKDSGLEELVIIQIKRTDIS